MMSIMIAIRKINNRVSSCDNVYNPVSKEKPSQLNDRFGYRGKGDEPRFGTRPCLLVGAGITETSPPRRQR